MKEVLEIYKSKAAEILFKRNTNPIFIRQSLIDYTDYFCPIVETHISDEESQEIINHFYSLERELNRQINN